MNEDKNNLEALAKVCNGNLFDMFNMSNGLQLEEIMQILHNMKPETNVSSMSVVESYQSL